jgi:L-fucose isomerase-like protein
VARGQRRLVPAIGVHQPDREPTPRGVSRPGEIVWSRVFLMDGRLHVDIGRGSVVDLPRDETERLWEATTPQWPIMHAVLHGVTRDQFMARNRANHIQVAYADDAPGADRALATKAAMFHAMGVAVHLCGVREPGAAPAGRAG